VDTYKFVDGDIIVTHDNYMYNLFPTRTPEVDPEKFPSLAGKYFLRYSYDFDVKEPTEWWCIVKDKEEDLSDYNQKIRYQIRRGLKKFEYRRVDPALIRANAYPVYDLCMREIEKTPLGEEAYQRQLAYEVETGIPVEYIGIFQEGALIGYSKNFASDKEGRVFCESYYIPREYYRQSVIYGLISWENRFYINERGYEYTMFGTKTLLHPSNIDQFLLGRMELRKAYCKMYVVYDFRTRFLLGVLYPIRRTLEKVESEKLLPVKALIEQERIARSFDQPTAPCN
jgi:hypothetical protein